MNDRIAWFDMDGSLFDFDGHMRTSLAPLCTPDERQLLETTPLRDLERYPHLQARMELIKSIPRWWLKMPPLKMGFDVFEMAKIVGFDCRILTKGPKSTTNAWTEKVQCCQKYLGYDINVAIVSSKAEMYGRVLYDDYQAYMSAWLENRPRGLGIMPVTESNKDFSHPNVVKFDGSNVAEVQMALQRAWDRQSKEPLVLAGQI